MRPLKGVVMSDGAIACENGLVIRDNTPKGIKRHEAVLVQYDFVHKRVASITPDVPSEDIADLSSHYEAPATPGGHGELNDMDES